MSLIGKTLASHGRASHARAIVQIFRFGFLGNRTTECREPDVTVAHRNSGAPYAPQVGDPDIRANIRTSKSTAIFNPLTTTPIHVRYRRCLHHCKRLLSLFLTVLTMPNLV